jgi:hypothetical protein
MNMEADKLLFRLVTFDCFPHLELKDENRFLCNATGEEGIIPILLIQGIMQVLLSLLSKLLRRKQGEQKLREICLYILGSYQTAFIKVANLYR